MRSEFKSATQIYVNPIHFELQLILKKLSFFAYPDLMTKIDEIRKIARNSFMVIFAFWIQIWNPNLCKSHIFSITANIWEMIFFCIPGPDDQNRWNRKNCPKFFHRVIFAFWFQICNPNLCKSHTFWNTANIEKWPFFALWPKLMKSEKLPEILS